ncbi:hypothetical protein MHU86_25233 [Fragilaria crotonensis]|nr:hypothetical protein MHU86_25233 [Fragilaria crotonensis]
MMARQQRLKDIRLEWETPVVDGWKRLKDDADTNVIWNPGALEVVCKTVSGCITPSSEGRSSTDEVLPQLHHAATLNAGESAVVQGGYIHDRMSQLSPVSSGEPNPEPDSDDLRKCAACNVRDPVVECKGEARHPLCARCLDIAVMKAPPSTTGDFQLLCLRDQCSSQPFTDVDLYFVIHANAWTEWWHRNRDDFLYEYTANGSSTGSQG